MYLHLVCSSHVIQMRSTNVLHGHFGYVFPFWEFHQAMARSRKMAKVQLVAIFWLADLHELSNINNSRLFWRESWWNGGTSFAWFLRFSGRAKTAETVAVWASGKTGTGFRLWDWWTGTVEQNRYSLHSIKFHCKIWGMDGIDSTVVFFEWQLPGIIGMALVARLIWEVVLCVLHHCPDGDFWSGTRSHQSRVTDCKS